MLEGKRVTLRGLEVEDAKIIIEHFNDLEVRRFLGHPAAFSREEEEKWIRSGWERRQKGEAYVFGIEFNEKKELIGTIALEGIESINRSAELGIAIWQKQYWGKGLGTEAINLLLDYGFNLLNLHRIHLTVLQDNERAQRAYSKVGFQLMGRHRERIFKDGVFHDLLIMDILANEFQRSG